MSVSGLDKWAPKLKDSVKASGFNDLEKSVIKATRCNMKPPKEKHVRALLGYTERNGPKVTELVHLLCKRLEAPEWMIIMKTLILIHRMLRDGKSQFINELKYRVEAFQALAKFTDMVTQEAHHQSVFVRKYSRFIEEKVLVFKTIKIEFEKDPTVVQNFTIEENLDRLPRLQSLLNALLNCKGSKDHINNQIIVSAFSLLLKDSFRLYRSLNEGVIKLLEEFFTMNLADAEKSLAIYKLFVRETDSTISFFEVCKRFARTQLPELQHAPTTLVEALEHYVADLSSGKSAVEAGKGGAAVAAKEAVHGKDAQAARAKQEKITKQTENLLQDSNSSSDSDDNSDEDDELTGNAGRNPFDPFATDANAQKQAKKVAKAAAAKGVDPNDPFGLNTSGNDELPTFAGFSDSAAPPASQKNDIMALFATPASSASKPAPDFGFGNSNAFGPSTGGFANTGFGNTGGFGNSTGGFGNSTGGFGNSTGGFGNTGGFGSTTGGFGNSTPTFGGPSTGGFGSSNAGFGNSAPTFGGSKTSGWGAPVAQGPASNGASSSPFDGLVAFGGKTAATSQPSGAPSTTGVSRPNDNPFGNSSTGGDAFNPFG